MRLRKKIPNTNQSNVSYIRKHAYALGTFVTEQGQVEVKVRV